MKSFWKTKKPKEKKDMNWAEATWKYPRLKPNKDYDKDGVKNQFDCKPFDFKRQHIKKEHKERIKLLKEDWGFSKEEAIEHLRDVEDENI